MKPTLQALEMPEEAKQAGAWLERLLLSPYLGALVAELTAVHGEMPRQPLAEVLEGRLDEVLTSGLRVFPETLRALLRQPVALLELQERILAESGGYWNRQVASSRELDDFVAAGRGRLERFLIAEGRHPSPAPAPVSLPFTPRWFSRPWVVSMGTAAAVLLVVLLYRHFEPTKTRPPETTAWGWNKPGALPKGKLPAEYLATLADEADEWFAERPQGPAALAQRIGELRQGCAKLIFARHEALGSADRRWLVERCRDWAVELDRQLEGLEAGREPAHVQESVNEIVKRMSGALRNRAKQSRTGGARPHIEVRIARKGWPFPRDRHGSQPTQ
jgi:hypothetical protein